MTKKEFFEDVGPKIVDFSYQEKARPIMIAMMGIVPDNQQLEKEAIYAALTNSRNIEVRLIPNHKFIIELHS